MENFDNNSFNKSDEKFEMSLRPAHLLEFVGQLKVIKQLEILIGASKKRKENVYK